MKIWNKIKSWIVKPYMKPLVLKDEIKVADLQYKTKKQLEGQLFLDRCPKFYHCFLIFPIRGSGSP